MAASREPSAEPASEHPKSPSKRIEFRGTPADSLTRGDEALQAHAYAEAFSHYQELLAGDDTAVPLVDYRLGAKTGIELLRETRTRSRSGPVILFTGRGHSRTDMEALDAGADDYIEKAGLTPALLDRVRAVYPATGAN